MAYIDGAKAATEPLLLPQTNQKKIPKKRRYRRCKSVAPLAENISQELTLLHSESILGKLHPSLKQVAIVLGVYLVVGTICFFLVRHQMKGKKTNGLIDSLYSCIVSMTTVGHGDLMPDSTMSKLFSSVFSFTGMALVGQILSKAADYLAEKQEILLVKAIQMSQQKGSPTEIPKENETNTVAYKWVTHLIINLVLMFSGTFFLSVVEELDIVDAFYCSCSTITTLGYGDRSFTTPGGRFFAVFWILSSSTSLTHFFLYMAEYNSDGRQKSLVKWVLSQMPRNVDLEAADLDDDEAVGVAEFVMYKLKEMGKISQEDISLLMKKFDELDADQKGKLSAAYDIMLAPAPETVK